MKEVITIDIIGLIAEYNPLHFGHIHLIKKVKTLYPNSIIICITPSSFTERGDVMIINKWNKAKICLDNDIDLIIELPFAYATQAADIFAKGALKILNHLKINKLVFGSESNNLENLLTLANTELTDTSFNKLVKTYLNEGNNYPTAMSKALTKTIGFTIKEPNDLLALSYIKEIKKNNYHIEPISIKRIGSYHDDQIIENITNASLIRKKISQNERVTPYIPQDEDQYLYKNLNIEKYFPYLKYKIISTKDLSIYNTINEGIENKIKKEILNTNSWKELTESLKSKRYTYNKINRMLIHILTSFTKEEANSLTIDYIRLIGFNQKGQNYLKKIKKELDIPIITNYKPNLSTLLDIEFKALSIYYLPIKDNLIKKEYQKKPIIKP